MIRTAPPPPPPEDLTRVPRRARASGDPVGPTYATPSDTGFAVLSLKHDVAAVMRNTIAQLDDELQTIESTLTDATDLTAGGRRLLDRAADQVTATKARVDTLWPPIPSDD